MSSEFDWELLLTDEPGGGGGGMSSSVAATTAPTAIATTTTTTGMVAMSTNLASPSRRAMSPRRGKAPVPPQRTHEDIATTTAVDHKGGQHHHHHHTSDTGDDDRRRRAARRDRGGAADDDDDGDDDDDEHDGDNDANNGDAANGGGGGGAAGDGVVLDDDKVGGADAAADDDDADDPLDPFNDEGTQEAARRDIVERAYWERYERRMFARQVERRARERASLALGAANRRTPAELAREALLDEFVRRNVFDAVPLSGSGGGGGGGAGDAEARDVLRDLLGDEQAHGAEPSRAHRMREPSDSGSRDDAAMRTSTSDGAEAAAAAAGGAAEQMIVVPHFAVIDKWKPYAAEPSRRCALARQRGYIVSQWQDPYNELADAWPDDSSVGGGSGLRSSSALTRSSSQIGLLRRSASLAALADEVDVSQSGADAGSGALIKNAVDPSYWVSPKQHKRAAPPKKRTPKPPGDGSSAGTGKRKGSDKQSVDIDNRYPEPPADRTAAPPAMQRRRFDEQTAANTLSLVVYAPHIVQMLSDGPGAAVVADSKQEEQLARRFVMSDHVQRFFSLTRWFDVERLLFKEYFTAVGRDWVLLSCLMCGTKSPTQVRNYFYNKRSVIMQSVNESTLSPAQIAMLSAGKLPEEPAAPVGVAVAASSTSTVDGLALDRVPAASSSLAFASPPFVQLLVDSLQREDTLLKRLLLSNKLGTVGTVWASLRGVAPQGCDWAQLPPTKDGVVDDISLLDTSFPSIFPPGTYAARSSSIDEIVSLFDSIMYAIQVGVCRLLASPKALEAAGAPPTAAVANAARPDAPSGAAASSASAAAVAAAAATPTPKKKGRKLKTEETPTKAAAADPAASLTPVRKRTKVDAANAAATAAAAAAAAAVVVMPQPMALLPQIDFTAQLDPALIPHAQYYRNVQVTYEHKLDDMPCVCAPCIAFLQAYGFFFDYAAPQADPAVHAAHVAQLNSFDMMAAAAAAAAAAAGKKAKPGKATPKGKAKQPEAVVAASGEIPFVPCTPGCLQCAVDLANRRGNFGMYSVPDVLLPTFLALQARSRQALAPVPVMLPPPPPPPAPVAKPKPEKKPPRLNPDGTPARGPGRPRLTPAPVAASVEPQSMSLLPRVPSLAGAPHAERARLAILHRARREVLLACKRLYVSQCEQTSFAVRQLVDAASDTSDQRALLGAMRAEGNRLRRFKHFVLSLACDRLAVLARQLNDESGGFKPAKRGPVSKKV